MLQIEYQLTQREFSDYYYYTCWQAPERKGLRLKFYIVGPALYLLFMGAIFYRSDSTSGHLSSIIIGSLGVTALILLVRFRTWSSFDKQARKLIEQSSPGSVLPKLELTLSENGIFGKTGVAE